MNQQSGAEKSQRSARRANTQQGSFPLAVRGQLGYHIEQVDRFLERARSTYDHDQDAAKPVTSEEIRHVAFGLKRRGYSARFVDAAMDRLEEVFYERERRAFIETHGEEAWWSEVGQLLREVRGRLDRPRGKRFRTRSIFASGYRKTQVDAFLDRISALFAGEDQLKTSDVRAVVFHTQWRGYDEDQVDALLDSVIELLLATR